MIYSKSILFFTIATITLLGCRDPQLNTFDQDISQLNLSPSLSDEFTSQVNASASRFMTDTPVSALVQNVSIEKLDVPDSDPNDYYEEVNYLYTVKVLESYRGDVSGEINYLMISEPSDLTNIDKTPYIVTLCTTNDGLFWPDVGASLPATPETVAAARELAKILDQAQTSFSDCE